MRNKSLFLVMFFSALFLTISCSNKKQVSAFTEQVDTLLLNASFQGQVLVAKGNKIIFSKGYGLCNPKDSASDPITETSTFEAGSITKPLTAAAILLLEKDNKLSLEDKLSKYFPDYVHGDEITLKMMLNMRSGLTDCINASEDFFPRSVSRKIDRLQLKNEPVEKDIVIKYFYDAPLLAPPDSTYFYCNTNYILLANIIEQVSGVTYQDFIQQNIFNRCKMTYSNLNFQDTDTKGYDYKGRYYSIPASLAIGCGDLNTNTLDLLKWNTALAKGKVIPKKAFKRMITTDASYGLGVYHKDNMIFHGGTTNVFNAYNSYYLDSGLSIIVLSNAPINKINTAGIAGKIYKLYQSVN